MTPALLLLVLPLFLVLNACLNIFFVRRPNFIFSEVSLSVAVIVPLRNEEKNVAALISCLRKQRGVRELSFHFLDDNSSDDTYELVAAQILDDPRSMIYRGAELPNEWLGKPFALDQLVGSTSSQIVVMMDADVRLEEDAVARAIATMQENNLDFVSPYPKQVALSWSERLIQPLLQWSWMSTVPLKIAQRSSNPAFAVANGQFFIVRRESLLAIGGISSIKSEIIDDIALARNLLRGGFHGCVVDGSEIATCRMYSSWSQLREGYSKSLRVAFGGLSGSFLAIALLFVSGVLPFLVALTVPSLSAYGWIGYDAVVISRVLSAQATQGRVRDALLHPLAVVLLIFLIVRSWAMRGKTQWKGRVI